MPKKPKDKDVEESKNPATAAHERDAVEAKEPAGDMDPDLEAKRSGPPKAASAMPKPLADPDDEASKPSEQFDRSGPVPDPRSVEAKLKDPTFDPEGHERLRLAEESRRTGEPVPTTTDVDEHGNPMMPGEQKT